MVDHFGTRLKQLLDDANVSQNEFAEFVGYSPASITKWIKNRGKPSFEIMCKICDKFGCSADWLLGLSEKPDVHEFEHEGIRWIEDIPDWLEDSQRVAFQEVFKIFRKFVIDGIQRSDLNNSIEISVRDSAATLQAALKMGALRITHVPRNDELEQKLKSQFKIKCAIVADVPEYIDGTPPRIEFVTHLAATQAMKQLRNPIAIGLGSGQTMLRFAEQSMPHVTNLRGTKWIPLMTFPENKFAPLSANAIAILMSQRHPGSIALQHPFIDTNVNGTDSMLADQLSEALKQITTVFMSVNGIGRSQTWQGEKLDFVEEFRAANYETEIKPLSTMYEYLVKTNQDESFGGEMLGWMLDKSGKIYPELLEMNRMYYHSVELARIRDLTAFGAVVWLIAARRYKADAVLMAIKSGLANAVVIDREIALYLLKNS